MIASNNILTDGPISLPVPPNPTRPILTELTDDKNDHSGWAFTSGGLCISLTAIDREEIFSHMYTPTDFVGG